MKNKISTSESCVSPIPRSHIMGSLNRIHRNNNFINKKKINTILFGGEVGEQMQDEEKAWDIIRDLRDRCVKPQMHNPTEGELEEVIRALRVLWLLLPPIKRHRGEKNKTFFLRTLHEVEEFRRVDMFAAK